MPSLRVLGELAWLHQLPHEAAWDETLDGVLASSWWSVSRVDDELSIGCTLPALPGSLATSGPFRVLHVDGPIPHGTSGVVAGLARPLAEAGISTFVMSSFDSCSVLVAADRLGEACDALLVAGWSIHS